MSPRPLHSTSSDTALRKIYVLQWPPMRNTRTNVLRCSQRGCLQCFMCQCTLPVPMYSVAINGGKHFNNYIISFNICAFAQERNKHSVLNNTTTKTPKPFLRGGRAGAKNLTKGGFKVIERLFFSPTHPPHLESKWLR